jgi:hypothetical protein
VRAFGFRKLQIGGVRSKFLGFCLYFLRQVYLHFSRVCGEYYVPYLPNLTNIISDTESLGNGRQTFKKLSPKALQSFIIYPFSSMGFFILWPFVRSSTGNLFTTSG